ncbi:hypothetical protein [Sphingopyxis sp. PET50]|uniref:hypothetical protein n=1 Tax=Sphingopyxis sp. PET50 TaxID=2976533 RepID=UPI0021AF7DCF|nr:hypothetical protein [Sphingopyxis sp. PET50]
MPHNVGPAAYGPWFDVGGRKVRQVIRRADGAGIATFQCERIWGRNTQGLPERPPVTSSRGEGGMSFQGLEDDRGKVILPTVYRQVRIVPGRGVFIMSHLGDQTYERYDPATGARTPAVDIAEIIDNSLSGAPWRVGVYTMQAVADLPPAERGKPWRQQLRPATLEVFDESGAVVLKRENIHPKPADETREVYGRSQWSPPVIVKSWPAPQYATPSYNSARSRLWLISYDIVAGSQAHELLDLDFQPLINPLPVAPVRTAFGPDFPVADDSGWAVPLPVGEDLFVPISTTGQPILPPGGIGYFKPDILENHFFAIFSGPEGPTASLIYYRIDDKGHIDKSVAYRTAEFVKTRAEGRSNGEYFQSGSNWLIAQPVNGPWRVLAMGKYSYSRGGIGRTAPTRDALIGQLFEISVAEVQEKVNSQRWKQYFADQRAAEVRAAQKAADDARAARDPRYAARRAGPGAYAAYLKRLPFADRSDSVEPGIPALRELLAMPGIAAADAEWANLRIRQINDIERRMRQPQVASGSYGSSYSSAGSTDSWATYRQQSADHQSTLKALQDYTYGRTNQYPFSYWSKR